MSPTPADLPRTDAEWQARLSPEQFRVLRQHGTERPGSSPLDKNYAPGNYYCAGCGALLFTSDTKFNSGTGWPSFTPPYPERLAPATIFPTGCTGWRFTAIPVAVIWGTCFLMAPRLQANAIALTVWLSFLCPHRVMGLCLEFCLHPSPCPPD